MSDTPETDKLANKGLHELSYISQMTELARTLERERDEAIAKRDELREALQSRIVQLEAALDAMVEGVARSHQ